MYYLINQPQLKVRRLKYRDVLRWPKNFFWIFHKILQKNVNKLFDQPNNLFQLKAEVQKWVYLPELQIFLPTCLYQDLHSQELCWVLRIQGGTGDESILWVQFTFVYDCSFIQYALSKYGVQTLFQILDRQLDFTEMIH